MSSKKTFTKKSVTDRIITPKMGIHAMSTFDKLPFAYSKNKPYINAKKNYGSQDLELTDEMAAFYNEEFGKDIRPGMWAKHIGMGILKFTKVKDFLNPEETEAYPQARIIFDKNSEDDMQTVKYINWLDDCLDKLMQEKAPFTPKYMSPPRTRLINNMDNIDYDFGTRLYDTYEEAGERIYVNPPSLKPEFLKLIRADKATEERPAGCLKTCLPYTKMVERKETKPIIVISDEDFKGLAPNTLPEKFLSLPNNMRVYFTYFVTGVASSQAGIKLSVKISEIYFFKDLHAQYQEPMIKEDSGEGGIYMPDFSDMGLDLESSALEHALAAGTKATKESDEEESEEDDSGDE